MLEQQSKSSTVYDYNGLNNDLITLAKFLILYESEIRGLKEEGELQNISPEAYRIFEQEIDPYISKVEGRKEIDNWECQRYEQKLIYASINVDLILALCKHLRDAFCHNHLKKEDDLIFIKDINIRNKKVTAIGFLPYNSVIKFLSQLVADTEDSLNKQV